MSSYLISYDLSQPGRNYDALIEHLKTYGTWSHPLESVWIVVTDKSTADIRDAATGHMDANDKILVVKLAGEGAWRGIPKDVSDWLLKHL